MLMYQKSMFDRYCCIRHFFRSKTLEKLLQKVLFTCTIMTGESTLPANVLYIPLPGYFTDDDVSFYDGPGMLIRQTVKPCINST